MLKSVSARRGERNDSNEVFVRRRRRNERVEGGDVDDIACSRYAGGSGRVVVGVGEWVSVCGLGEKGEEAIEPRGEV